MEPGPARRLENVKYGPTAMLRGLLHRFRASRAVLRSKRRTPAVRYAIFSTAFDREFRGVAGGIAAYEKELGQREATRTLLRRDTHRIEKGLLMRPRRSLFALEYIEALVRCLGVQIDAADEGRSDEAEVQWAADVLRAYFDCTASHPVRDRAHEAFLGIEGRLPAPRGAAPYRRDLSGAPPVSFDDFFRLARQRRSVRWFLPTPVPRASLQQAMLAARESPSACNRQPFVFRVFDDPERVAKVASVPMGTAGYVQQIPCIIVVVGQMRNFFDERDRHLIYIDGSLAAMSFILALESLGLSSCMINWPDIPAKERQMVRAIGLEADERPVFLIAVGYPDPDGLVGHSAKKSLDDLLVFDPR